MKDIINGIKKGLFFVVLFFMAGLLFQAAGRLIPDKHYYYICISDNGKYNCEEWKPKDQHPLGGCIVSERVNKLIDEYLKHESQMRSLIEKKYDIYSQIHKLVYQTGGNAADVIDARRKELASR